MEPEDYADVLQQLRDVFELIVPRHGGEIVRIDGDGVLCVFGYPISHEDAGRRAVEASIDLHNAVKLLDQAYAASALPIQLHTGIHSGIILVRSGDLVRGRFELLGDATNIAARLCDAAIADQIIVSADTLGPDLAFFQTGRRREMALKGRQAGLSVVEILGRLPVETRFAARATARATPFVGRHTELARLNAAIDLCRTGRSEIVTLAGPAGIGKSRLASEFLQHSSINGAHVHRSYCEAYLGARPLQPFLQLANSLLTDDAALEWDAIRPILRILAVADEPIDHQLPDFDALASAFQTLLSHFAANNKGPIILHVDDWQWADDASRQLVERVFEHQELPVLFLFSTRNYDRLQAPNGGAGIIDLLPLAPEESSAAIENLLPISDPFLVERIRDQAGGSPLYIEELCYASNQVTGKLIHYDRSVWLDMLVQSRFARLPARCASILRIASVIGSTIPTWLFEALTGLTAGARELLELAAEDFVFVGEVPNTLRFKHGATRDAVYNSFSLRERQALHKQVTVALHERSALAGEVEYYEPLAYHYGASGSAEQALRYSILAGDNALKASALDRAQAHFREAIKWLVALPVATNRTEQLYKTVNKFGLASVVDPSPEQLNVLEAAELAASARGNVEGLAYARYWLGAIHYGLGHPRNSIAKLEQAYSHTEQLGKYALLDQLKANLGQSYFANCQYQQSKQYLDEAIVAMLLGPLKGVATGLAYAVGSRALMQADQGQFDEAGQDFELIEQILNGAQPIMYGSILNKRSAVHIWRGDYRQAIQSAESGITHGMRTRSRYYTVMSKALLGYAAWQLDHDPAHIASLKQATAWFLAGASQHRTSLCHGWLADILSQTGQVEGARFYASRAFQRARQGDRLGEAMAARAMARLAAKGQGSRSIDHYLNIAYRSATLRGSQREHSETRLCEAQIRLEQADYGSATHLGTSALTAFKAMQMDPQIQQAEALLLAISNR
jgi:class 3 adenylate cyclase/tetratricopeptide (TPR) repeat protein